MGKERKIGREGGRGRGERGSGRTVRFWERTHETEI